MRVVDLAQELEVPPSEVLQACQRLAIDATWAGAELSASDAIVLRAELANSSSLDLTEPTAAAPAATGAPGAMPPPAVGSMPELLDELAPGAPQADVAAGADGGAGTDDAVPMAPTAGPLQRGAGPLPGGPVPSGAAPVRPSARSGAAGRKAKREHRFDRGVRSSVIALALALAAIVGSSWLEGPWFVAALWAFALLAVVIGLVLAGKAWYRSSTHPDRIRGTWMAVVLVAVAALFLVGLGASAYVVLRSAPAADAPLGIGELNAVERLRWGRHRIAVMRHTGWESAAKEVGSCWKDARRSSDDQVTKRREDRVEFGQNRTSCNDRHRSEVLAQWPADKDADSAFPGAAELERRFLQRCQEVLADRRASALRAGRPPLPNVGVRIEHPTEEGWERGDHDVACVADDPGEGLTRRLR